ncbi:hypothetical protein Tco_0015649 [Tanacetum coccineum]
MEDDVDISVLTMEQYKALIPDDIKPGIMNPKIGDDIKFQINANFIWELRCKLFTGIDDEDSYENVHTNYLKEQTLYKLKVKIYSVNDPTSGIRACVETLNKKNSIDVNVNGDLEEEPAPAGETSAPPAPKTAKQLVTKTNQERVKSILLLAIPDEYLLKFHNVADAKSLWEAIKSRFGGNEESKKMQKNVLKHQFENFSTTLNESLDKAYDRFQKLIKSTPANDRFSKSDGYHAVPSFNKELPNPQELTYLFAGLDE